VDDLWAARHGDRGSSADRNWRDGIRFEGYKKANRSRDSTGSLL